MSGEGRSFLGRSVSRRTFLGGAAVTAIGLAASSCGPAAAGGGGRARSIDYWNLFGGGDGVRMVQMENQFRRSHPGTKLNAVTLSWGNPYYTKLSMAIAGGSPPDVAVMHLAKIGAYAPAGLLEELRPEELSRYGIGPEKFLPQVLDFAKYDGRIYAVPLDTHPFVQYYNRDICRKAGVLDPGGSLVPMDSPGRVMKVLERVKKVTGQWGVSFYPNDSAGPWRLFLTLYGQMKKGAPILSHDAKRVVMDDAKAEQALGFMAGLALRYRVMPINMDYGGSVALFQNGQAGLYWNGEWEVTTFQAAKMNFNMVPFPKVYTYKAAQADHHSFIIPKGVDPAHKRTALEFISFMLKDSYVWAQGGHIPAYQPVVQSEKYRHLEPQSNYAGVAKYVVTDPIAWFSGSGSDMEAHASGIFQAVMAGRMSPRQGVRQFRAYLQQEVSLPKPY
ncbi:extracellular solute-binding protein [Rubrobacter calidifluminis]|uniref:extracellular solute-binding protein n=1 Tax=Rubrobacter calidifluminis TaxID=1392640 RepID=UPI002360B9BF|nr:extracellular solute-binding protein [Rubrobacter calidifluminis]